jgi:hypothetical protein
VVLLPATPLPSQIVGLPAWLYGRLPIGKRNALPREKVLQALNAARLQEKPITDTAMRVALEELREAGVLIWSGQRGWALVEKGNREEAAEARAFLQARVDDLEHKLQIMDDAIAITFPPEPEPGRDLGPLFRKEE